MSDAKGHRVYKSSTQEQLDVVLPVPLELCLVLFFTPTAVTVFCYWHFVCILLSWFQVGTYKHWRTVGLATVTLFKFLISFGPYNVSHVVGYSREVKAGGHAWCCSVLSVLALAF